MGRGKRKLASRQGREYWLEIVTRFEASPCAHEEFATREGVNVATFRAWLYKLRSGGPRGSGGSGGAMPRSAGASAGFVEVAPLPKAMSSGACAVMVGGAIARFEQVPEAAYLAELLVRVGR